MICATEQLKAIAEALGYVILRSHIETNSVNILYKNKPTRFSPENNAEQREEILLWLETKRWVFETYRGDYIATNAHTQPIRVTSHCERLLQAACKQLGV